MTERLEARILEEQAKRLRAEMALQDRSVSRIVRRALDLYFQTLDLARTDGVCEEEARAIVGD